MRSSISQSSVWRLGAVLVVAACLLVTSSAQTQTKEKHQVDVNSASLKTLETLPGITPGLAQKIAAGRPYKNIDDLAKVKGLTSSKLNAIKDQITFGPGTAAAKPKPAKKKNTAPDAASQQTTTPKVKPSATAPPPATETAPTRSTAQPPPPTGSSAGHLAPGQTVNINTASLEELDALPGIGPTKAQAIIDYRNEHGQFSSIEDIQNVKGIKSGEFSKIKDNIRVR